MKNKQLLTLAVIVLSGTLLSGAAMAKGGCPNCGDGEGEMRGGGMPRMIAQLELTNDQLKSLKKNKKSKHRKMIGIRAALQEARLDLAEVLEEAKPDQKKVEKIADEIGDLHEKKVLQHADAVIFLKSILTPKQSKKLETLMLTHEGPGSWGMGQGKGKKGHRGHKKGKGR